jgi:hypothetical protein
MRPSILLLLLIWLASFSPLFAQDGSKAEPPLTNADIVGMLKDGLSTEIVVAKIKSSPAAFDTSPKKLTELKNSGLPESVILAMIQAPAAKTTTDSAPSGASPGSQREIRQAYILCSLDEKDVSWHPAAPSPERLNCGEKVSVLEENGSWYKIETPEGKVGDVSRFSVTQDKPTGKTLAAAIASGPVPANTLRAVAWRGMPWVTTSYYQQPSSSSTDCMGSGTWYGNMSQANVQCSTQYTPAQNVPINWTHYTIYNLVETVSSYMVIACTRNVVWSKCSYLVPGDTFSFEMKKGKVSVVGQREGKSKGQSLDFDIVSTEIKTR